MWVIQIKTDAGWKIAPQWKDKIFNEEHLPIQIISCIDEKWRSYYRVQHV